MREELGLDKVPARYDCDGREACDIMRDRLGDAAFVDACRAMALKYELRDGRKAEGTKDEDLVKSLWWRSMASHVEGYAQDPRCERPNFAPYERKSLPENVAKSMLPVLDYGFVRHIESWGEGDARMPEAAIIEAARQSTAGSFRGWKRDAKLLRYLHEHKHATPFEFAGLTIEVRAPIFVFRQWHRHRTQSYNEMSARYTELPAMDYTPSMHRLMTAGDTANKQAQGSKPLTEENARVFRQAIARQSAESQALYDAALIDGVPSELARLLVPVNRYSQMRATANLRNWLGFLTLRLDSHAQWEIRQYAGAVAHIISKEFPQTWALFIEGRNA